MKIDVRSNVDQVVKEMNKIAKKDMKRATRRAINTSAEKANKAMLNEIRIKIHNPVAFTKNNPTFIKYAYTNQDPQVAIVGVKDIQAGYLQYVEYGGVSKAKGKAKPVPTTKYKAPSGNIRGGRGAVKKMLGNKQQFFSGTPTGSNRDGGIYKRVGKNKLQKVAGWEPATQHDKKIRLGQRVQVMVDRTFEKELRKQFIAFS